jgi:hypothetical protein
VREHSGPIMVAKQRRKASPTTAPGLPWPLAIQYAEQAFEIMFAEQSMIIALRNFPPADAAEIDEEDGNS